MGKILADQLGLDLVDTDEVLERRVGCAIGDYVAENGWRPFEWWKRWSFDPFQISTNG